MILTFEIFVQNYTITTSNVGYTVNLLINCLWIVMNFEKWFLFWYVCWLLLAYLNSTKNPYCNFCALFFNRSINAKIFWAIKFLIKSIQNHQDFVEERTLKCTKNKPIDKSKNFKHCQIFKMVPSWVDCPQVNSITPRLAKAPFQPRIRGCWMLLRLWWHCNLEVVAEEDIQVGS